MKLKSLKFILLATAISLPCSAASVTVGSLVFGNPLTTFQGFEIVNETGPTDGCDAANSIPVCTVLSFGSTTLTVTLADNSTLIATPSGGFSFSPGAYIYGANVGDDSAQSFLFDPMLSIIGATFTGTLSQASFQVTDGTLLATFFSTGSFSVSLDLSGAPPLAAADIIVSDVPDDITTPEPTSGGLLLLSLPILILLRRSRTRAA